MIWAHSSSLKKWNYGAQGHRGAQRRALSMCQVPNRLSQVIAARAPILSFGIALSRACRGTASRYPHRHASVHRPRTWHRSRCRLARCGNERLWTAMADRRCAGRPAAGEAGARLPAWAAVADCQVATVALVRMRQSRAAPRRCRNKGMIVSTLSLPCQSGAWRRPESENIWMCTLAINGDMSFAFPASVVERCP